MTTTTPAAPSPIPEPYPLSFVALVAIRPIREPTRHPAKVTVPDLKLA
jgi:hypothetical protein